MATGLNCNMKNCVHFQVVMSKGCCGRKREAGVCALPEANGRVRHKACCTALPYCKFESRTEEPD